MMISRTRTQLKTFWWISGFFAVCTILFLLPHQQPLFEGHTMEWWLDDFSQTSFRSGPRVTGRQKKAIEAFHFFGKQGMEFLLDEMSMPRGFLSRYKIRVTNELRRASWGRFLGFKKQANHSEPAGFLFRHLEIPFEWTGVNLNQLKTASSYEIYYAMMVLRQATNHQAEIIRSIGPLLNHPNASSASFAAGTIAKLFQKTDTVPDLALYLPGMPTIQDTTALMTILSRHVDQSAFAKERLLQLAEGPESDRTFAATTFLLSPQSTRENAIQKLKTILLAANERNKPVKAPLIIFRPPQPSLPHTSKYLALLETSNQPLDGLQPILLKIADEMESTSITLQVARLHLGQNWDNSEIIDRLLNRIRQSGNWTPQHFTAFLSILLLEPKNDQAWNLFNQAMDHSSSQNEFLKKLDQAKDSQEPYWAITFIYENWDYRPYYEIGKQTLEHLKATESDSAKETKAQ